jgi:hypothetical protein
LQEATRLEKDTKVFRIWLMQHDAERVKRKKKKEEKKKKKKKKKKKRKRKRKKKKKKNISRKSKEFRGVALRDLKVGVR